MIRSIAPAALLAAPALAAPPAAYIASPDVSGIASQAASALQQAQAAYSAASNAAAAIPPVCPTVPPKDTLAGLVGTGAACTPRSDRTGIIDVQSGNTTLATNCTFSITFARSFTSSTPFIFAAVVDTSNTQMQCKIQTRSSAGGTGICAAAQSTLLNATALATGLTIAPFGTSCTAGTPVMFVGREPTQ